MLPKTFDDENLFRLFSVYGELREVHIIRGPDGASKGCAFIKFVKTEASLVAMSDMNDIIPEGATRPLVVKFADNTKKPNNLSLRSPNIPNGMRNSNFDDDGGMKLPPMYNNNFRHQYASHHLMYTEPNSVMNQPAPSHGYDHYQQQLYQQNN